MEDKLYHITSVKCSRSFSGQDKKRPVVKHRSVTDEDKVRYHEEDPSMAQVAKARRPRRHTTGGGSQNKEAIQKAKEMIANDPDVDAKAQDSNYGTLNRKELISMLKSRYGNDMEKYKSMKRNKNIDVEHRTVESSTLPKQKSHQLLSYKTSSGMNGHVRRGSTSSQESSQTSQESLPYSATPPSYDTHTTKAMQTAALRQYTQRNRAASSTSSMQSDEGHHTIPQVVEQRHHVVTRTKVTQQHGTPQQQQQINDQKQQNAQLQQLLDEQQQDHLRELERLRHEQQVTLSEKQSHVYVEQQQRQQQQEGQLRDLERLRHEQQVLLSEKQSHVYVEQQQQQQEEQEQSQDRVLYLQYKDEIKRVNMPRSISTLDTLKALFVTSFPGKLSMVRLDDRGLIYIKDKVADIFYELENIRDVQPRSHIQLRERATSYDSLTSSQSDMNNLDKRYTQSTSYNSATLPAHGRRPHNEHYAESLHDFEVRPRSGSGSSLRSDSVLTKPTWQNHQQPHQQPRQPVSYMNSGMMSPRTQKKQVQTTETSVYETRTGRNGSQKAAQGVGKPFVPLPEAPKLKAKRTIEKSKTGPTVEEQLSDLTSLLHTALNSDEEDGHTERTPGKLNQDLIVNLEALSEENYSKSPTKGSYYTPTALLAAKMRQVEGSPNENEHFSFNNTSSYVKSVSTAAGETDEQSEKGYMHDGPDEYMKGTKKGFESGLADELLQSLRGEEDEQSTTKTRHKVTTIKVSSGGSQKSTTMEGHADASVTSPPPTPSRNPSSRAAVQTLKATVSPAHQQEQKWTATTKVTTQSGQYKMDKRIGIASTAAALRNSILTLRSQVDELRLLQTNQSRNFKIYMSQSLQDFNSLASTVSQNMRNGKGTGHSIRERRFRVQEDHDGYVKRMQNTSNMLTAMEDETEQLRRDVIQRKRVLEMGKLNKLNTNLDSVGKSLAEMKSRFSGLHDMLKIVMAGELEIIVNEEKFLKDEPGNLDNLFARCKHLSGTLFTLQRLASVQQLAKSDGQQDANHNRVQGNATNTEDDSSEETKHRVTRTVRFTSDGYTGFL